MTLTLRTVDAYCKTCGDPRTHVIDASDPGSCYCVVCESTQVLQVPI